MPGKNEIVAGIRMEGGKEFREELTSINKSIAAQKSELKLVTAEYEGQANSLGKRRRKAMVGKAEF